MQDQNNKISRDRFRGHSPRSTTYKARSLDSDIAFAASAKRVVDYPEVSHRSSKPTTSKATPKKPKTDNEFKPFSDYGTDHTENRPVIYPGADQTPVTIFTKYHDESKYNQQKVLFKAAQGGGSASADKKTRRLRPSVRQVFVTLTALVAITMIAANLQSFLTNKTIQDQVVVAQSEDSAPKDVASSSSTDVDETPVSDSVYREYTVAPNMPKYITIDRIGVKSRIIQVGLSDSREVEAPMSIYNAGWYTGSSKPGEKGAMFIDGHVSGPSSEGVFYRLNELVPEDVITIETGNGVLHKYRVVELEKVNVESVNMNKALVSKDIDKQGLNLMTCGGEFNWQDQSFNERQLVYSVKI